MALFLAGTPRYGVSGAASVSGRFTANVPRALRAGTAQRTVPARNGVRLYQTKWQAIISDLHFARSTF
jgi:hypothetical protein